MGTDIHAVAEVKLAGRWHWLCELDIGRNYELFARLANVRNQWDYEAVAEGRGRPDGLSPITAHLLNEILGHGFWGESWISRSELSRLFIWYETVAGCPYSDARTWSDPGLPFAFWCGLGMGEESLLDDGRVIFWFDS